MHIAPCHRCGLKAGCAQNEIFREKVRGLGARSVRFACPILAREIRPGRRIIMHAKFATGGPYEDYWVGSFDVPATILDVQDRYRFTALIDEAALSREQWRDLKAYARAPDSVRIRGRVHHSRIVRFLDEPDQITTEAR